MRLPRDGAASFLFFFCFLIVFPEHHGSFLAQASPAGHELQLTAYGGIVEQEEQQQEEAGVDGPAVNLADADFHHLVKGWLLNDTRSTAAP